MNNLDCIYDMRRSRFEVNRLRHAAIHSLAILFGCSPTPGNWTCAHRPLDSFMCPFLPPFHSVSSLLHSCCHMFGDQLGLKAADCVRVSENALRIVLSLIALAAWLSLYAE